MRADHFMELLASVIEAGSIRRGDAKPSREFHYSAEQVRAIRNRVGKSQSEFAKMLGVPTSTLQNWEQGRREPSGSATTLLRMASQATRASSKASRKAR